MVYGCRPRLWPKLSRRPKRRRHALSRSSHRRYALFRSRRRPAAYRRSYRQRSRATNREDRHIFQITRKRAIAIAFCACIGTTGLALRDARAAAEPAAERFLGENPSDDVRAVLRWV